MDWLLLEELGNIDFSVANFGIGCKLVVTTGIKNEATDFEGVCTDINSKSPCKNYSVKKTYTDVHVERKFSYYTVVPRVQLLTKAKKKVTLA
ncbi:50S ribosomal subunit protein L19 [Candidatus Hodgkinia cicadicola]|nr:50S ribosomal subunit protein L19 [Candidatus Hodgkinia cicadicola]